MRFDIINQKIIRSVYACIGEAYRKRKCKAHFISRTTDADMENSKNQIWLDFTLPRQYISKEKYDEYIKQNINRS